MAYFLLLHSSLLSSLIFNWIALLVQRSMAFYFTRTDMMQLRFNSDNIRWHKGSEDLINSLLGDRIFQGRPLVMILSEIFPLQIQVMNVTRLVCKVFWLAENIFCGAFFNDLSSIHHDNSLCRFSHKC